jgi:predicted anti-sigma-YlaC factor YlaD
MHDDMRTLLNAYLDGELQGTRLLEMKLHLAACETCRNELKELRLVSDLLQAAPVPQFMPADRFVTNLNLRLPRRNWRDLPPRPFSLAWWLVPAGLLSAWFFVQTLFSLSNMASAAQVSGIFGQAANLLGGGGQQTLWYSAMTGLFGRAAVGATTTLPLLNQASVFGTNLLVGFLWQALIAFLYWGWMFAWWLYRRPRPMKMVNA